VSTGPVSPMPVVWSPDTRRHDPKHEVWVGVPTPGTEVAARVDAILEAVAGHPLVEATSHGREALHTVHDPDLVAFLSSVHDRWLAGEYVELVGQDRVVPYFFPTPAMTAGLPIRKAPAVHALAGRFAYDTMTTVGPGTWQAVAAAADCALTAAALVTAGAPTAYALARPPGHHATPAGYGGSCYLNNAALAAQALRDAGHERVAVVDLDAHHGNGTQAIFWERGDVLYGSLHVDPGAGWFPHVIGYADETGAAAGSGATRNLPLAPGTGDGPWVDAVSILRDWVSDTGCDALVVSLGVDAAADDPESPLEVTADGYRRAGVALGELALPTVLVQEGGYHLPSLGGLVAAHLDGHQEAWLSGTNGARSAGSCPSAPA
jgi:acetoin utilization deacetylase AcuC-like enzyme